jgi:hypothetical protein
MPELEVDDLVTPALQGRLTSFDFTADELWKKLN